MNNAYLHLILNHLPVIGVPFCVLLLVAGIVRKSDEIKKLSLWGFIVVALTAIPVYLTGEPAEEIVEHLPGTVHSMIESHEEAALFAFIAAEALGAAALAGLLFFRGARTPSAWFVGLILLASLTAGGLLGWTANLGGRIRHSEIRSQGLQQGEPEQGSEESENDERRRRKGDSRD